MSRCWVVLHRAIAVEYAPPRISYAKRHIVACYHDIMLSKEDNDLLTHTGPGTPGGALLRRYWQPIAVANEMKLGAAPLPIRIMSEDLVLFRDKGGELGLIGLRCPHRGVDLSYGRIESGGLRCLYHGWLFDRHGNCLDQPAEPERRRFQDKIRHKAYPVREKGGVIFAYMGPGEPPCIPNYDFLTVPEEYRLHFRVLQRCNWLQALEGSIDPSHVAFLHGVFDLGIAVANRASGEVRDPFKEDPHPHIETELTEFGFRLHCLHTLKDDRCFLRVTNFTFPNSAIIVGVESAQPSAGGFSGRWYVPVDDNTHYRFELIHTKNEPLDKSLYIAQRDREVGQDNVPFRNAANRYFQDRAEMETQTFSGLGRNFTAQDLFAIEAQGAIQDRTSEHLGSTDLAVTAMRQALLRGIRDMAAGKQPPNIVTDEAANEYRDLLVFRDYIDAGVSGPEFCRRLLSEQTAAAR
jgi:nitrite reductase/ring-hydroxylating ferredoxin subunit